ncbi:MAG: hypothetical protein ACK4E3_10635 [Brevundimonas sp.]|uniref:hypothetical protein n=1 Tax=Brevundimonas sp. TaxID=1871086 RepID=UPI00391CFF4B
MAGADGQHQSVGLRQAAHLLGRSYDWLQRHWRTLDGFPRPVLGASPRARPLWPAWAILDWRDGRRFAPDVPLYLQRAAPSISPISPISPTPAAANTDAEPRPTPTKGGGTITGRAARLLASAGR